MRELVLPQHACMLGTAYAVRWLPPQEASCGCFTSCVQVSEVLKRRPNAITEYIELESCGHVPMDEMPEQFMAAVTPFMQQVASQRPAGRAGPDDEDAGAEALQDVSDQPLQAIDMTRTERDALPVEPSLTS